MLRHVKEIGRVELNHPGFASRKELPGLQKKLRTEKGRLGAGRAILRVLTDEPAEAHGFVVEGKVRTEHGILAYLGLNDRERMPDRGVLHSETTYLAKVLCTPRREIPAGLDIVRLKADRRTAFELARLLTSAYSYYPVPIDPPAVLAALREMIPYGVVRDGRVVSALFGAPFDFGPLRTVEFTLSVTAPSARGVGMTAALASRIREEALERHKKLMLAETIAAPVMHSCHDLGMECRGVLREHYKIGIGEKTFTNFYLWSL